MNPQEEIPKNIPPKKKVNPILSPQKIISAYHHKPVNHAVQYLRRFSQDPQSTQN